MADNPSSTAAREALRPIPFNVPYCSGTEFEYMRQALAGGHISGDGSFSRKAQALLAGIVGCRRALLTTSCTDALEMSALLLDVGPGDEVVVPSFTFVSTANAFALRGAKIVFCDIRSDTLNLDETVLPTVISPRTKAVISVHYAGVGCEMAAILDTAGRDSIAVIEDNAHGLFGQYHGRNLGTFGSMATLSFHETKNITCGEGGALLINDEQFVERAEILREKGTDRSRFFRGQVDKYTWVDVGSSFLPSDLLGAYLLAQLEARETIQATRRRVWNRYQAELSDWAAAKGVTLPYIPAHCRQSYHMYYMLMPDGDSRDRLIAYLKERAIWSVFHYIPLHLSTMGRQYGGYAGQCPVTEDVSARLIRLPFYNSLTETDQARVIDAIVHFPL